MCSNMGAGGSTSGFSNAVSASVNYSALSKTEKLNYDVVSQQLQTREFQYDSNNLADMRRAANARAEVSGFMNDLKRTQERKAREREQKALTDAMLNALNTGALEFTVNGTTWRRKSRRGKTFTADR